MAMALEIRSLSAPATVEFGRRLGALLTGGERIALNGPLGSGKTCFTKGIARGLGCVEEGDVTSPTFSLMNRYDLDQPLYHFDFYRLSTAVSLNDIGFWEVLESKAVVVVEWADRIPEALVTNYLEISFSHVGETERQIGVLAHGVRHQFLIDPFLR